MLKIPDEVRRDEATVYNIKERYMVTSGMRTCGGRTGD